MTNGVSALVAEFAERFDEPTSSRLAPSDFDATFRHRLPDSYLELVAVYGLSVWLGGQFQLVDPRRYAPVLPLVFRHDRDLHVEDCEVVALSGFGTMILWHAQLGSLEIDPIHQWVSAPTMVHPRELNLARELELSILGLDDELYLAYDRDGAPMFDECVDKHGPLAPDFIFAPALHPALGGALVADNFRPVRAPEALALMAQVDQFKLIDPEPGQMNIVRLIGA